MSLLREKKLIYGISCCYTSANYESITSEEFYDSMIDLGAYFVWYFHYMPVGNDAAPELLPTPEQRPVFTKRSVDSNIREKLTGSSALHDDDGLPPEPASLTGFPQIYIYRT